MITDTKYLGVQIDDKLQWDRHIEHVKAEELRAVGLIKHAKKFISSGDLQKTYRRIFLATFPSLLLGFGVVLVKPNLIFS